MVLLDLLLFLLPYPVLYALTPLALRAAGVVVSDNFNQSLRNTVGAYAILILVAGLAGSSSLTLLTGPMMVIIVLLVGRDVVRHHRKNRTTVALLLATVAVMIAVPVLTSIVTFTVSSVPLLWSAHALAWLGLASFWLTRTSIDEVHQARLVATAVHILSVTVLALGFLMFS
jgi:hypothetical protein